MSARPMLLAGLEGPLDVEMVRVGDRALSRGELRAVAGVLARRLAGVRRVAVWAEPGLEACAALIGAVAAGVTAVPLNPRAGARELGHVVVDSSPGAVLCAPGAELSDVLDGVERVELELDGAPELDASPPPEPDPEAPALVVYTSGTTGAPKGAVLPRRALAANLDALADAWAWTSADHLAHALPLFHVHGLVLGLLGPARRGGHLEHLGRFSTAGVGDALRRGATLLFGVPTMYRRLLADAERDAALAQALGGARLLVSGSAALPATDHERFARVTGQRIVERYGLTETLIVCAVRADGERRPGSVGGPLAGVELALLDESGAELDVFDDETMGEVAVRGASLFAGYLNRPDATAAAHRPGRWFATGDLATRAADGTLRIIGRRATDLIQTGGYRVGAGEVEAALREHPAVADAAVTGEPDPDLGERIVAWVVAVDGVPPPGAEELAQHVTGLLAAHKRPRTVRWVDDLPRNAMGKVLKARLGGDLDSPLDVERLRKPDGRALALYSRRDRAR